MNAAFIKGIFVAKLYSYITGILLVCIISFLHCSQIFVDFQDYYDAKILTVASVVAVVVAAIALFFPFSFLFCWV